MGAYCGANGEGPKMELRFCVHISEKKVYLHEIHILNESSTFAGSDVVLCPDLTCPRLKSGSGDNTTFRSAFEGRDCDNVRDNC